jgi:hypothetical protein
VHVTVANHLYVSGQLLSYCQPLLGQLVHVNLFAERSCALATLCVTLMFSVHHSNKKLTVANHLYVSGQPLSHSSCTGSELVHVYFLAAISLRIRAARVS